MGKKIIEYNDILMYPDKSSNMSVLVEMQLQAEMVKRKEYLKKHPYEIWQNQTDGKWYVYLPDRDKKRVLKVRKTRKEIEDVIVAYWKDQEENPTVEDVFEEWNDRRLSLEQIVASTHSRNKQIFQRHYMQFGKRKIRAIQEEEWEDFLEEQISEFKLTSKQFSNLKTITRGLLRRAKKKKLVFFNIEEMFADLDVSERQFRKVIKTDEQEVFSEDELPEVFDYLMAKPDIRNLGILMMFVTGIRVGELVTLKYEDFKDNTFSIRRTESRVPKAGGGSDYIVKDFPKTEAGVRQAIIPRDYAWIIDKCRNLNPFGEYVISDKGKRLTTNSIRSRMRTMCKSLKLVQKSPHKARKTYGSILLDNNIDQRLILSVMGHTDIACTEEHYHRNRRSLERKSEILSNLPEFTYRTALENVS